MSAINTIKQKDAVHVICDGGAFNPDGTLFAHAIKCFPLPHISAVVACRGSQLLMPTLACFLAAFATFDEMKRNASSRIYEGHRLLRDRLSNGLQGTDFEMTVAGWSESRGPEIFAIASHSIGGKIPFDVVDLDTVNISPFDVAMHPEFYARFKPGTTADDLDPAEDGLWILDLQRRHPVKHLFTEHTGVTVGGTAQLTTVTRDAIVTRVLHRWPDEIGKMISSERAKEK